MQTAPERHLRRLYVRLSIRTIERLDAQAERLELSRAGTIRHALSRWLDATEKANQ